MIGRTSSKYLVGLGVVGLAVAVAAGACNQSAADDGDGDVCLVTSVDDVLDEWPETSRDVADRTIELYGEPDAATASMLVWYDNGPWMATIVHRDPVQHDFPAPHEDVLEQKIPYRAPVDKFAEVAAYDGSVVLERTLGTMSARCDREEANFLALNLANDLILGVVDVETARRTYAETIAALDRGETPEYTQGLMFDVDRGGGTPDPDGPIDE